ncbi:terminase small subunit [Sphingosinicella rhizophila]|uniref:Terminase small subunit n=1 Tax=Sphingosinicella rhizophila TaxID=3050082 RepID=A0ABU3Q552_9SPHN|nr:hypothetical protein [Sphingosinicella sp. GR2756]MDT9598526.1 hypothetical protein [Sphingosinicella sp. GR2756]
MPPLTNPRHERFAQELAKGEAASSAYVKAGYLANDSNAARLNGNERIVARVQQLQAKAAERVEVTVADIAKQLDDDRDFARKNGAASAAVSATVAKAKILGLVVERLEHTGRGGKPIAVDHGIQAEGHSMEELRNLLADRIAESFEKRPAAPAASGGQTT